MSFGLMALTSDETALLEMIEQLWDEAHEEHGDALFTMIERGEISGAMIRARALRIMGGIKITRTVAA